MAGTDSHSATDHGPGTSPSLAGSMAAALSQDQHNERPTAVAKRDVSAAKSAEVRSESKAIEHLSPASPIPSSSTTSASTADASMVEPSGIRLTLFGRCRAYLAELIHSRSAPGFLVSLIVHTALLLVLAVWTIASTATGGRVISLIAAMGEEQGEMNFELVNSQMASGEVHDDASSSVEASLLATTGSDTISAGSMGEGLKTLADAQGVGSGRAATSNQTAAGELQASVASSSVNASLSSTSIEGRAPQSRQRLALQRGGNAESEAAVERALEWLAAHQRGNGSWSLVHTKDECGPYCTHAGSPERYDPAATGLALLAFLGAGYTHRDGKYADVVNRGLYFLIQVQEQTPAGGSFLYSSPQGMYNQGVASFALCEAYQLSKDESLKTPATRAIEYIIYAQNDVGGWGYLPKRPGDLTLTGWQTMALKSADAAGIYIPAHVIVNIDRFLDTQTDKEKVFYGYTSPGKSETCTAIGLLIRLFRNWPHSDPRILKGADFLERQGVSAHDIYRNYYATLLLFHIGGAGFDRWNTSMRDSLVQTQSRNGHANGSWHFEDKFGDVGGRLYTTAMAAMTLEVYYRFAPIYLNSDKPFEFRAQ